MDNAAVRDQNFLHRAEFRFSQSHGPIFASRGQPLAVRAE
jgi:hypothetical protein